MKKLLASAFVSLLAIAAGAQRNIDIEHYRFSIELYDESDNIVGSAAITARFGAAVNSMRLDLNLLDAKGKGMVVDTVTGANIDHVTRYGDSLSIHFSKPISQDTATFTVAYHGIPKDGLIISKNKYGHRSFFADNWPNRGHNWLPCIDEPGDKATVEFIVIAPAHYQVVSNGVMVEETNLSATRKLTHWREDVPLSTKVMVIGAADFAVNLSGMINGCIPVYSWVYPEDRANGFYDYAQAMDILPFYISHVGPYGYRKLANVQSKTIFGGLENANTIFYSENSITGTRKSETLLAHEIAHQWFGNMATEKTFPHLWLSEGFATYMTILYMENKHGTDTAISMLKDDRQQVIEFARSSDLPVVDEKSSFMGLLNPNSYQKGGWVLHMLRRQLGDTVFYQCVKAYYAMYAGKNADTRDLQKVFETVAHRDLSVFFQQWLYTPGIPKIEIVTTFDKDRKKLKVQVRQLQKTPFQFPLELGINDGSPKMRVEKLSIKEAVASFEFDCKVKPLAVVPDPKCSLLADMSVRIE